jgi:hypothetical protein
VPTVIGAALRHAARGWIDQAAPRRGLRLIGFGRDAVPGDQRRTGQIRISAAIRDRAAMSAGSVRRCLRERLMDPNLEPLPSRARHRRDRGSRRTHDYGANVNHSGVLRRRPLSGGRAPA